MVRATTYCSHKWCAAICISENNIDLQLLNNRAQNTKLNTVTPQRTNSQSRGRTTVSFYFTVDNKKSNREWSTVRQKILSLGVFTSRKLKYISLVTSNFRVQIYIIQLTLSLNTILNYKFMKTLLTLQSLVEEGMEPTLHFHTTD